MKANEAIKLRYQLLDFLRGFAVFLMIIFHFSYDMNYFGFFNINFQKDMFWFLFPRVIVTLFLICVGISLYLVHGKEWRLKTFAKRFLKIAFWAAVISAATYFFFPSRWIYFGTLHSIALGSLLAYPLARTPILALILGLVVLMMSFVFHIELVLNPRLPHHSMDYIPLYPWIAVILFGVFLGGVGIHKKNLPDNLVTRSLISLGKHSLIIYILHQPLLFGSIYLLSLIKR